MFSSEKLSKAHTALQYYNNFLLLVRKFNALFYILSPYYTYIIVI